MKSFFVSWYSVSLLLFGFLGLLFVWYFKFFVWIDCKNYEKRVVKVKCGKINFNLYGIYICYWFGVEWNWDGNEDKEYGGKNEI